MSGDKPEFVLRRMSDTTDEALLNEIRRVDKLVKLPKLTRTEFMKHARVSPTTLRRRFGTWQSALECAGLGHKFDASTSSNNSGIGRREISNEEILSELLQLAERLGTEILTTDQIRGELGMSTQLLINRFGSTSNALLAAGLEQSQRGRRYSDEERFENLLNVWTVLGRQPKYLEMQQAPSVVGGKAYVTRYGSWRKALEAFVERVNADEHAPKTIMEVQTSISEAERSNGDIDKPQDAQDRRDIRLGQRFRVLNRDKFKCVLCGNCPALDPACQLHVDHILPFSRGGKTTDENLRSLCALCNIGRGDRYSS